jgi:hypothetical protein
LTRIATMPAITRRTMARLRTVTNLGDLQDAMEEEDSKFGATIKVEPVKGGNLSSDSDDDTAEMSEDEDDADDKLVNEVKNADTHKDRKHGYRLSLQHFIMFLYNKMTKKEHYKVLLRKVKGGSAKQRSSLMRAGPEYHPINLLQLHPQVFLSFLLSITNAKKKEYNKSYGGHRSALTHLFTMCEVSPSVSFHAKMKRYMAGLKNTSAAARGEKGGKLGEGKEPLPFEVYRALCKWLLEEGDAESIFGHCFLTTTWNLMCRS